MAIKQDLQCVGLALIASKRQADQWKLRFKMGQSSLRKEQGRATALKKWLKGKNQKIQELKSAGNILLVLTALSCSKQQQASPILQREAPFYVH